MPELDLAKTALIIKGNNGPAEDVLRSSLNKKRLVFSEYDVSYGSRSAYLHPESRECTPAVQFAEPELHLRFDDEMKDPPGWKFGFEKDDCDVLLGEKEGIIRNKKKISHTHFRIF